MYLYHIRINKQTNKAIRDGSGQNLTLDLIKPVVILANQTQPKQFFYEPQQLEEIFLLTQKLFFHRRTKFSQN